MVNRKRCRHRQVHSGTAMVIQKKSSFLFVAPWHISFFIWCQRSFCLQHRQTEAWWRQTTLSGKVSPCPACWIDCGDGKMCRWELNLFFTEVSFMVSVRMSPNRCPLEPCCLDFQVELRWRRWKAVVLQKEIHRQTQTLRGRHSDGQSQRTALRSSHWVLHHGTSSAHHDQARWSCFKTNQSLLFFHSDRQASVNGLFPAARLVSSCCLESWSLVHVYHRSWESDWNTVDAPGQTASPHWMKVQLRTNCDKQWIRRQTKSCKRWHGLVRQISACLFLRGNVTNQTISLNIHFIFDGRVAGHLGDAVGEKNP